MQYRSVCFLAVFICIAVAFAGCTGTPGSSGTAATGTPAPAGTGGVEDKLQPSPTDTLSSANMVTVDVGEKDYLGTIPVIFQGGTGQIHVKKIDVTLYRSDGTTSTASIGNRKGDMAELEGTKQTDRVVVYITFDNGDRMKTNDVLSAYRTRM